MDEFNNAIIHDYCFASQFVASWINVGGFDSKTGNKYGGKLKFMTWLRSLGLTEDECRFIFNFATNGKLELQEHAKRFLNSYPITASDIEKFNREDLGKES